MTPRQPGRLTERTIAPLARTMNWACRLARKLLRIPPPRVSREEAVRIAKAEAVRRGAIVGVVFIYEGLRTYEVWLNASRESASAKIDNQNGTVAEWSYGYPR